MKQSPPEGWPLGAWVVYHLDHWVLHFYAWLDRLDALVAKVCRILLKPRLSEWRQLEKSLRPKVGEMRTMVANLRHPLAHTGAGGPTRGIDEEQLWEPGLLIGFDQDMAPYYYESSAKSQDRWHRMAFNATARGLAASEAMFAELNRRLQ